MLTRQMLTRKGEPIGVAGWSVPGFTGLRTLGSGGFGEVMLARNDASGALVAIKYLRQNLLSDAGFTSLFRGEAAALAALDDPNVVRLYEYVESPGGVAIIMELIDGVAPRHPGPPGQHHRTGRTGRLQGSLRGTDRRPPARGGAPRLQTGERPDQW